jgi:ABC-type dipeptide/oligopeptide/nickel transport system permease subunit
LKASQSLRRFAGREPLLWFGLVFLALLILFAIFGPSIRDAQLGGVAKREGFTSVYDPVARPFQHWGGPTTLGTDQQGRDNLARLASGARISLTVGFIVQIVAIVLGVTVGVLGVYAPRWVATPLMRLTDGMFAFPDILLSWWSA